MANLKLFGILSLFSLVAAVPLKFRRSLEIKPHIVNGTDATIEEFPFIVSLQYILNETRSFHSCGGSIINELWILTVS